MIENIGAYSQVDYDKGYQQGRAEAFDELLMKFEKRTQYLKLTRRECIELLRDLAYELKEQKE